MNFHDSLLRQSDVDLLTCNGWLNDNLIHFYFEYLNHEVIPHGRMLCVGPPVTQLLKLSSVPTILELANSLEFKNKDYIFFALNDLNEKLSSGGSHWSLLVVDKPRNKIYHLDSMPHGNAACAEEMVRRLDIVLYRRFALRPGPVVYQENSYDCGIHVLCNAHHLIEHLCHRGADIDEIPPCAIHVIRDKRVEMLHLINNLAQAH